MTDKKLLGIGIGGAALAAICCFTPALVLLLGAIGLSAWLGWLDYALLPALVLFAGLIVFALVRKGRGAADACCDTGRAPKGGKADG